MAKRLLVEEGCLEYKSILTVEERGGQKITPGYIVFEESMRYPNIKGRQKKRNAQWTKKFYVGG